MADTTRMLEEIQRLLLAGDMTRIRTLLPQMSEDEKKLLQARTGPEAYARLTQKRGRRRGAAKGRVVAIHGIMGSSLASVDADGGEEKVWINPVSLAFGRIDRFKLAADGSPADPRYQVKPVGLLAEYLALIDALDSQWDVKPFAYDWRKDVDDSATQLNETIRTWAGGGPCHIVAHSMGGLVSRRFIQKFPATWQSMRDADGKGRGGRLIMLGTPNRGAMVVPQIFTGAETLVKWLARLDIGHNLDELLAIINTFPGSYQMLPSPAFVPATADDRKQLFDLANWGDFPVTQALLDRGRDFQAGLEPVVDGERMIYIAGYDQETPFRVRVKAPGQFEYQITNDGDGRVPHELGLLPGVPTYWVQEKHGDLQKNGNVLDALHELLEKGATTQLPREKPATRAMPSRAGWVEAKALAEPPQDIANLANALQATRGKRSRAAPDKALTESAETWLASAALGGTVHRATTISGKAPPGKVAVAKIDTPRPTLNIEVVWGDITQTSGHIYCVGHYEGLLPQQAELALDGVVSGISNPWNKASRDQLVLTRLTQRGILRGALGHVDIYPWAAKSSAGQRRLVAIAGMGRAGHFGRLQLRQLSRSLTAAVGALPDVRTVCTVLIGSGAGNMQVADAAQTMALGMSDAIAAHEVKSIIDTVRIVEQDFGRALVIHNALSELAAADNEITQRIVLKIAPDLVHGKAGRTSGNYGLAIAIAAASGLGARRGTVQRNISVDALLRAIPQGAGLRDKARASLDNLTGIAKRGTPVDLAEVAARLQEQGATGYDDSTARLSMTWQGDSICVTALTRTAVIPERRMSVDKSLLDETVADMIDPPPEEREELSTVLTGLLIPRDFRDVLRQGEAVIIEVDREMAKVHWEMLAGDLTAEQCARPISLQKPLARQLRTTYSPIPTLDEPNQAEIRILLIGDPGDGEYHLPGARREALEMKKFFDSLNEEGKAKQVQVTALIGPDYPGRKDGRLRPGDEELNDPGIQPATRRHVLGLLMRERFDILHYCGHGAFDPTDSTRSGWLFESGNLLSARELTQVDVAPRLVVANACLSGLTGQATSLADVGAPRIPPQNPELLLLPSLADEFFHRGVRNYIGTAWEIDDAGAILFATMLYRALLGGGNTKTDAEPVTLGEALRLAREALYEHESSFGVLWAAYQHYGDPHFTLPRAQAMRRLR